jgi:hypothetical protein
MHAFRDPKSETVPIGGGTYGFRRHLKPIPAQLDVVCVISNPLRFRSRLDLYRVFRKHVIDSGARLTTVEIAFGNRPFEITSQDTANSRNVKLRTNSEIWHKENGLNIGVSRLERDWEYVAWVDADVTFTRPDWVQETIHQLQHYPIVQMFSFATDLNDRYEHADNFYGTGIKPASWGYCHVHGLPAVNTDLRRQVDAGRMLGTANAPKLAPDGYTIIQGGYYWHPGYAWACRRDAWDNLGGLIDHSIHGAGDYLMASALTGHLTLPDWSKPSYVAPIMEWKARADKYIQGNFGYVDGLILHHWHGPKVKRGYHDRWRILHDNDFDPTIDIKRDWQGLWTLTDAKPGLRDALRQYLRTRDEDEPAQRKV